MRSALKEKSLRWRMLLASIAYVCMRKVERTCTSEALKSDAGMFSVGFVAPVGFVFILSSNAAEQVCRLEAFDIVCSGKSTLVPLQFLEGTNRQEGMHVTKSTSCFRREMEKLVWRNVLYKTVGEAGLSKHCSVRTKWLLCLTGYFHMNLLVTLYGNALERGDHTENGVANDFRHEELNGNLNIIYYYLGFQFWP